ncbi:MAG: ABC transporter ATP-binding protein [Anaerolineales bacterium]|nr:ABC transporter ATP-binding protein [Anaerolineales bacterium]
MPGVRLVNLLKQFGKTIAVDRIRLDIEDGEILTMLGPSGCGKTTTLRCIAGFLIPDEGEIYLGNQHVTTLPPEQRDIGFVFQNYALWPHMTVYDNLAFGLRLRQISKTEIKTRVDNALAMVRLSGFAERYPRQLSGGQQQRIALARALVIEPNVLLLDEPLSNLDAQLREEMRFEIRELQKRLGITAVYVTHDQAEALALSDRIAVMNKGVITQIGTPEQIYNQPSNRFVAGFIGLSSFVEGTVTQLNQANGCAVVTTSDQVNLRVPGDHLSPQQKVTLAIRPEYITLKKNMTEAVPEQANVLEGEVIRAAYLGDVIDYRISIGQWVLRVHTPTDSILPAGEKVQLIIPPERITLIPGDLGQS